MAGVPTSVRNAAVVTVLAALTWVLAESQTLQTETVTSRVTLGESPEDPGALGPVVRVAPGQTWDGRIEVQVAGSAVLIDGLVDALRGRVVFAIGREIPDDPGTHELDLREALRTTEAFRDSGVTVESVTPDRVSVQVDQLEARDVPIAVRLPVGVQVSTPARATPDTARIVAPSEAFRFAGDDLTATAIVSADSVATLVPGREQVVGGVRVDPPADLAGGWATRIEPPLVGVVISLETRSQSMTIPRMPVWVQLPPSELGRWRIEIEPADQDLLDVVVTGPREALERIQRNEVRPRAFIALSFEELEAGVGSKRAQIEGLPSGVTPRVERDEVRLRIERVEDDPGDPAGPGETP